MTDTKLKYHKVFNQRGENGEPSVYEKAMGEWQRGDEFVTPLNDHYFYSFSIDLEGNVVEHYCDNHKGRRVVFDDLTGALRIPLPIDPRNPERGLVGMLEGEWSLQTPSAPKFDDKWAVVHRDYEEIYFADTPVLALLKALAAQSGVMV